MSADFSALTTLSALSVALRKKDVSPLEITRACLERIERYDARIHSFITVLTKAALAAAAKAESEILKGQYRGPLHGIPYASKDLFLTRGIRTTCGSRILRTFVPTYDAAVIERLHGAGAILLGKLNMHEFAFGTTSVNPHYGAVRNPWDHQRVSGGSSGGSAAAIACGFAFLTLGTDTGGSIRIPAALCGVSGLKPTYGRLSRFGAYPLSWSLDHVGPLAATAEDLALAMNVLAGHDARDPGSAGAPVPDYTSALGRGLTGIRVGVPAGLFREGLHHEVRVQVDRAIERLRQLGADVSPVVVDRLPDASRAASIVLFAEAGASLQKWHRTRAAALGADVRQRLDFAATVTAADYLTAQRVRRRVDEAFRQVFRAVDVLVTPQLPITAPLIEESAVSINGRTEPVPAALTRFTRTFNLTGLPSMSVCCGYSSGGLPIAFQVAGRPFAEATVLRVAHTYQQHERHTLARPTIDQ
jgi:aspartyl-tRNA(Asn)/glutamyl-tRNA(Gln) amidotransferase subunit A